MKVNIILCFDEWNKGDDIINNFVRKREIIRYILLRFGIVLRLGKNK